MLEVTVSVTVQVPGLAYVPPGTVPPFRVTDEAVLETVPPHCGVAGGTATSSPAGRLSVKLTPVYGEGVGFRRVMVRVEEPPAWKFCGENDFETPKDVHSVAPKLRKYWLPLECTEWRWRG